MTLIAVERIKLFTTRSPWWCMLVAVVLTIGLASLVAAEAGTQFPMSVGTSQAGYRFGLIVMMVMSTLAVTTEYRFGTIRATFLAVPHRVSALLAKTAVVAVLAAVIGEITAFASWAVARAIRPSAALDLNNAQAWRNVAGMGLIYLVTAVIAVAVGLLIRQTAGAIVILLVYTLLVENLVTLIPNIGDKIQKWLPFTVGDNFLSAGAVATRGGPGGPPVASSMPLDAWASLGYFAGFGVVLLVIALVVANRRDA
jgi:ABC-2 type transport system permease protein